ncbi:MAG: hypothetical protein IGS38_04755 [Synechococcales cyanobacterium M58_A2018_015]|nr:hypothetical protein [Synechococcales cyanobacterium M58_A2018_015]
MTHRLQIVTIAALCAAVVVNGTHAHAQFYSDGSLLLNDIPYMAFYDYLTIGLDTPTSEVLKTTRPDRQPAQPYLPETSLRFQHRAEVTNQVRQEVSHRFAQAGPSLAHQIHAEFERADVVGEFRRLLARYGYDPDNLAHAMAAFLILQWEVVTGETANAAQMHGAANQVADALRSSPLLDRMSDTEKQVIADSLAYQAILSVLVHRDLEQRGDFDGMQRLRASIIRGAQELGWDFERVSLTAQGFQTRS